jgi:hypothetical protein
LGLVWLPYSNGHFFLGISSPGPWRIRTTPFRSSSIRWRSRRQRLGFFEEVASDKDCKRYHQWIKAQAEITNHLSISDVFTLKSDTYFIDNILNFVVKSLKDKLGLTDAPVAFFSSFFFTKLCCHGHEDPALKNKYSYEEVAGWTRETF